MKATASYEAYQKSPYRSIKHSTYFDVYDHLFGDFRGKPITFVEIGVLGGGSLFMWREFFGPEARIVGVDLNPNAKKWEEHGFEIFIGSQSDEDFWQNFKSEVGEIDLILDDGGHTYDQQIITTECLIDSIRDGGVLAVEDTHTSYMSGFGSRRYSFIEYVKTMTDRINNRFSEFSDLASEKRVWSIEVFESIVAFRVNRAASNLQSEPTDNGGSADHASDFRYGDNQAVGAFNSFIRRLAFLRRFPIVRRLATFVRHQIANRESKSKKYFNSRAS